VEQGGLAPPRAARVISQVAAGLDAAHARGLVHRDVKPPNILIELRGDAEHAYLSDFGLTKRVGSGNSLTAAGTWVGTPDYVAPEQVEGRQVDARTDVYALGCVLFQALTGSAPYPRDSDVAVLYAHMQDPPPSVKAVRPELPAEFDTVIARALAKDPDDRYPSAGDLGRAAVAAAAGQVPTYVEHSVATGAAAGGRTATPAPPPQPWAPSPPTPPEAAPAPSPPPPAAPGRRFPRVAAAVAAALVLAAGAAGVLLLGGGSDEEPGKRAAAPAGPLPEPAKPQIDRIALGGNAEPATVTAVGKDVYALDRRSGELVIVDGGSGKVAARLPVGKNPTAIALDPNGDRAWAASAGDRTVVEVDTRRRRLAGQPFAVRRVPLHLAYANGKLVVASNTRLGWVDPDTHRDVGKPARVFAAITAVSMSGASVDIVTAHGATAARYGLGSDLNIQDSTQLDTDDIPTGLAVDGNTAWISVSTRGIVGGDPLSSGDEPYGTIERVNLAAGVKYNRRSIGRPIRVGREPTGVALHRGVAWIPSHGDGTVTRIDQRSGRLIGKPLKVDRIAFGGVTATDDALWVVGEEDLIRIRPAA
jgi:DNA-binding beta-propeller fold protein YncE